MLKNLLNQIKNYKFKFVDINFDKIVESNINLIFVNLKQSDINILTTLTLFLIDDISIRYDINIIEQWTQNNGRDIISLCLTLLPFIKDEYYTKIFSLTDIIYIDDIKSIPTSILDIDMVSCLKKNMPYSNFSLGLLNLNKDNLLELYKDDIHLIYHIIYNNFLAILETIKITNGKLFVNWLNVIPLINYQSSKFYIKSKKEIESIIQDNSDANIIKNLSENMGLWLGDYYNVLTNGFFYSIKKIKWVIFCRKISNKYYYSIQYLNKIFSIDTIFKYADYDSLDTLDQNLFDNKLLELQENIKNNIATYIDVEYEKDLFKNLFIFMKNNFIDMNLLSKDFNPFILKDDTIDTIDLDIDEFNSTKKITDLDLIKCLEFLGKNPNLLWKYLKETLLELKATIYGKYLIKEIKDEITLKYVSTLDMNFFNLLIHKKKYNINLKNIYNIAKILCHDTSNNFTNYSINFKGLNESEILQFFNKFGDKKVAFLKIRNNIRLQEGTEDNYKIILNEIKNGWNEIKIILIWDYLSYNGLLSEYRVNLSPKDKRISDLKIYFNNNPELFNANYFMSNSSYDSLINQDKNNLKNFIKYKDMIIKELKFYTFYANDWMSQLNFFTHFISQQIMFVTGSTGTGKSTQVPKLTLYALKMYDYKLNGRVICTQPRISPTEENAIRIAREMGLEIERDFDGMKLNTSNYYIQYKDNKRKHTKEECSHLTLRMVTDGTLLEDLVTNPFLKKKFKMRRNNITNIDEYSYSSKNVYDVVIVDEAHEHNTNMDLILTLMRQTCFYNNSIRLFIVSATMDDDEPIYRYYYKLINSNIMYPIKQYNLYHYILDTKNIQIDAYYLDRRLNISAPREGGQYIVREFYDENIELKFTDNMKNNYKIAQDESYILINNICTNNITGDILLFSIGQREIIDSVNRLNDILPPGNIALPYYSEMNSEYRNIISTIGTSISKIRNKRNLIGEQWGATYYNVKDVMENTYKRAIIIATNVAEASITIDSLKYVVDTGFSKVNRYDEITDSSTINIEMISEASRVQRKGRIGRVSEGDAYFLYGKNKRLNVKPKYGITLDDFHLNFLKLSTQYIEDENIGNNYPLWLGGFSPYLPDLFENNYRILDKIKDNKDVLDFQNLLKYNIIPIIKTQFTLNNTTIPLNYFYHFDEYHLYELPEYFKRYPDGYSHINLFDKKGDFYIIHPFEDKIKRNIMGQIIKYNSINLDSNKLNDRLFNPLINNMRVKMQYLAIELPQNKEDINDINFKIFKKTNYTDKINSIIQLMGTEFNEKEAVVLFMGSGYDIIIETCMVLSIVKTISKIQPTVSILMKKTGKIIEIDKMKKLFGSDSDISSLYLICKKLFDSLSNLSIYKLIISIKDGKYQTNKEIEKSSYYIYYKKLVKLFRNQKYLELGDTSDNIQKTINLFTFLLNNGNLDNMKGYLTWFKESDFIYRELSNDLNKNNIYVQKIVEDLYLDYTIIKEYHNILIRIIIIILTAKKDLDTDYNEMGVLDWTLQLKPYFTKMNVDNTIESKLNTCFFFAQPLIAVRKPDSGINNYLNTRDGSIISLNTIFNNTNTLCNELGSYLYYYSIDKGKMNLIYNIDSSILSKFYPIYYNSNNIKNNYNISTFNDTKGYYEIIPITYSYSEWNRLIYTVNNNYRLDIFPFNNILFPTILIYIKNIII